MNGSSLLVGRDSSSTSELSLPRTRQEALAEIALLESVIQRRSGHSLDLNEAATRIQATLPPKVWPLLEPARYKGLHGGRGGIKSHTFARLLLMKCLREPGTRFLCGREIQQSLKESVKLLLEDLIKEFDLGALFPVFETRIQTPGDGFIIFNGLQNHTTDSVKSFEALNGAWVEEAQNLSDRSLKLLRPTIRADHSELWFSWNPEKSTDPIDTLLRGPVLPKHAIIIETNWQDNPFFPQVLRDEMEVDYARDPEAAAHVWGGQYAMRSKASVFKNWHALEFDTPEDAEFLFGGDWGFATDPSVLVRGFVAEGAFARALRSVLGLRAKRILVLDREAWAVGCEIDDTPELFDALDPERPAMAREYSIIADSARPETISFMQRHGYPRLEAARKGPGSVEEGVKFLQTFDIVVHSRYCPHVVEELTDYKFKVHRLTGQVLPELEDKKNHTIDSTRYMVEPLNLDDQGVTW